nr:MAG TPA: hypothetical protein [Caudoviricetes sp.]
MCTLQKSFQQVFNIQYKKIDCTQFKKFSTLMKKIFHG